MTSLSAILPVAALAVMIVASMIGGERVLRTGMLAAGMLFAAMAVDGHWLLAGPGLLLALANGFALMRLGAPASEHDADFQLFAGRHLPRLPAGQARLLFAQGSVINGRPGEALLREGDPVDRLLCLLGGRAVVEAGEAPVGQVDVGELIGESVLLPDARATATVRLTEASRLWSIDRRTLDAFLKDHPATGDALRNASIAGFRDKLASANQRQVQGS